MSRGKITPISVSGVRNVGHVGLKGTMNALFLKDLADKTRRGLRGRIEAGKSGGGLCYGYRVVRSLNGNTLTTGEREIEPAEAAIVVRILREFVSGVSPEDIAKRLNREHVSGPCGGKWSPSTIHGHHARGTGILNNELYVGRLVWNRLRYIKESDTRPSSLAAEPQVRVGNRGVHQGDEPPSDGATGGPGCGGARGDAP